jgi:excinuclease UvrABC nuclease subunit
MLENVCLSKQRREEYPEKNVIYILTTEDHKKRNIYIVGKAKNLNTRLSTYNKTCDHQVIYYKECKTEEEMNTVEVMVLSKLKPYKEQTNRDRFILPEKSDISLFTKIVDECVLFASEI